jgi:hypothetical protein
MFAKDRSLVLAYATSMLPLSPSSQELPTLQHPHAPHERLTTLFGSALSMLETQTLALNDVPKGLEAICHIWQQIATLTNSVVDKSQTRTPTTIAVDMLASIPNLCGAVDDSNMANDPVGPRKQAATNTTPGWKSVLDPACGSGLLVAMLVHRTMVESGLVGEKDRSKGSSSSMTTTTTTTTTTTRQKQRNKIIQWCAAMSSVIHAIDIDETSCMLTRISLLFAFRPLVLKLQELNNTKAPTSKTQEERQPSAFPPLKIICGSAPQLLLNHGHGSLGNNDTRFSSPLKYKYDVLIQNPPYRNKMRDLEENNGHAFSFLSTAAATPATKLHHHNLYGYFLYMGLQCMHTTDSTMVAVVLRNVFDLHKYPQDVHFHQHLLEKYTIMSIHYNSVESFNHLPHASRHIHGIATVTIKIHSGKANANHRVCVVETADGPGNQTEEQNNIEHKLVAKVTKTNGKQSYVLQQHLLRDGLGVTDALLVHKYTRQTLLNHWVHLTKEVEA